MDEDTSKSHLGASSLIGLTKVGYRSRAITCQCIVRNKVHMHIYIITTSKKPVVKVIVMSSRCLHQSPPSIISSFPCIRLDSQTRRFTFAPVTSPFLGLPFASVKIPAKELFCFVRSPVSVRGIFIADDLNGVLGLEEAKSIISTSFFFGFKVVLAV
jgi:hypothetical protein